MNLTSDAKHPLLVAVPCYGNRVLPRFGQAREFFFAEVDPGDGILHTLQRCRWDIYREPQLVRWLRQEGIEAVLCGGIHPRFQLALGAEGIRVVWGFRGEVEDVLRQWLKEERSPSEDIYPTEPLADQTDRQLRQNAHQGCTRRKGQGETT